jgi:hypothetical protein
MKVKLQNKASFIFKINKVYTEIYISFCAHISLKINVSDTNNLPPPPPMNQEYQSTVLNLGWPTFAPRENVTYI